MENRGGSLISEALENLKVEIDNYYEIINEIQNTSLRNPYAKIEIPDLPEALELYEMCTEMHIPLVDGGLLDQPNIWLLEYGICKKRKEIWKQLNKNNNAPAQKQNMEDDLNIKFAQDK